MEATAPKPLPYGDHLCPWWLAYTFDNPLRRLVHPPDQVLRKYVQAGMTVMDLGCGFGHFCLGLARLVGGDGQVLAVDLQQKMLDKTMSRARRAGLAARIEPRLCGPDGLGIEDKIDFALAANVLHEVGDLPGFLAEVFSLLRPGGLFYAMEPSWHVKAGPFEAEIELALEAGFVEVERPRLISERCVVFRTPVK
ncbi:MAG: methyltransferase domain-containing protein [Thermodesulfobacteriota bacterium]